MEAYKIEENEITGVRTFNNDDVLQPDEIIGEKCVRARLQNGVIVETRTQADETAEVERLEKQTVKELLDQFEEDGNEFYYEVRDLVKYHLSKDTINEVQYKAIRVTLEPALRPLRLGDWDIAQDNLLEIERPNGILGQLYDIVKNKIDNYLA